MAPSLTGDTAPPPTPTTPLLDHIVILVPHAFVASPPAWLRAAFAVYPGGRHADGRTENVLVLLADGVYLEFIAFVPGLDPAERHRHRWGREPEGAVIDWALTLPGEPDGKEGGGGDDDDDAGIPPAVAAAFAEVRRKVARAGTPLSYGAPAAGGRTRPDGEVLRWATAAAYRSVAPATAGGAEEPVAPGLLPFWCLDATPRARRVPYEQDGATTHGCGAVGAAAVALTPPAAAQPDLARVYGALLGEGWALRAPGPRPEHPGARFRLGRGDDAPGGLRLHLFTNNSDWAGRTVGGEVGPGLSLAFELVFAGPQ